VVELERKETDFYITVNFFQMAVNGSLIVCFPVAPGIYWKFLVSVCIIMQTETNIPRYLSDYNQTGI
jgi:hypothetical protein